MATRLLAAGSARSDVEPLLAIGDLADLTALLRCLVDVTPPPWLAEHVVAAYRRCIPHLQFAPLTVARLLGVTPIMHERWAG